MRRMIEMHTFRLFAISIMVYTAFMVNPHTAQSQERWQEAWKTPEQIVRIMEKLPADIDTTLPPPVIFPEEPYTLGEDNTVYWSSQSTQQILDSLDLGLQLLFFEIKASYEDIVRWGAVEVGDDSATFYNLPIGVPINYHLRYYARDSQGEFSRSLWSLPVTSIQDGNPPSLQAFELIDLQRSGGVPWVIGPTIQLYAQASDPDGQVMQIAILEKSIFIDDTTLFDLEEPKETVDFTIPYPIQTPPHETLTLTCWVYDVAGQTSNQLSETLFWIDGSEGEGKLLCFPNPYNPEEDGSLTIKVGVPEVEEARIYDPFGNLVAVLKKDLEVKFFSWNGRNDKGDPVSNGGYICVASGQTHLYCKIAILR